MLFDRMVAYYVVNGVLVIMNVAEFYKRLKEKFIERDGNVLFVRPTNQYNKKVEKGYR
ncbi:hypothetical protein JOD02_002059 [Caldicoprobacter guelmensis]|uniref:hypothetical protein n=1 Tax=Caldicoprobacter guelmensis TaxID=1170224 RepID=UPI00195BE6A7|nr:hypothetical protein [Caldicoprobacter guelmensis]MBM7583181.1 hypothetical protein [Caldicoprobacter guelmensis]